MSIFYTTSSVSDTRDNPSLVPMQEQQHQVAALKQIEARAQQEEKVQGPGVQAPLLPRAEPLQQQQQRGSAARIESVTHEASGAKEAAKDSSSNCGRCSNLGGGRVCGTSNCADCGAHSKDCRAPCPPPQKDLESVQNKAQHSNSRSVGASPAIRAAATAAEVTVAANAKGAGPEGTLGTLALREGRTLATVPSTQLEVSVQEVRTIRLSA